jgi:DNA polymerase-3 subunit epsilon
VIPLDRPLTCFDLETTGSNPATARIVQIGIIQIHPDGAQTRWSSLVNPECPIPAEATAIHGITDDMVKDARTFAQIAPRVIKAFQDCDFAGYNIVRFDLPVIQAEFQRAGIDTAVPPGVQPPRILDPYVLWTKMEPRTLSAAMKKFLGRELEGAHDALADIEATVEILDHMTTAWLPDSLRTVEALHQYAFPAIPGAIDVGARFVFRDDGVPCVNFGKHRGVPMRDVDRGFWTWLLKQDFPEESRALARNALNGVFPVKEAA